MSLLSFAKKVAGGDATDETKKPAAKKSEEKKQAPATKEQVKKDTKSEPVMVVPASGLYMEPLITEKGFSTPGVYGFRVRTTASKRQIAETVEARYNVRPKAVRTLVVRPKARRRGATTGATAAWKKAYVTLPAGKTIDVTA